MAKAANDEFAHLPISAGQRYRLRMKRDGRCTVCGEPAASVSYCLKHLVKKREWDRKRVGCKRRHYNTLGYRLEKGIKDEFADLPISPQGRYRLRMKRDNRCQQCGKPVVSGCVCLKHMVDRRERQRKRLGCNHRLYCSASYRLEAKAKASARKKRSKKRSGRA